MGKYYRREVSLMDTGLLPRRSMSKPSYDPLGLNLDMAQEKGDEEIVEAVVAALRETGKAPPMTLMDWLMTKCNSPGDFIVDQRPTTSRWEGNKSVDDIINDIRNWGKECTLPPPRKPQRWWSIVPLESIEEMDRLDRCRENIPKLFGYPTTLVYFVGYNKENPRGKADLWCVPDEGLILEIVPEPDDLKAFLNPDRNPDCFPSFPLPEGIKL